MQGRGHSLLLGIKEEIIKTAAIYFLSHPFIFQFLFVFYKIANMSTMIFI